MREAEIYREQIAAMAAFLEAQVAEVPDDIFYHRPGPKLNPAGFLHWHILRIWDLDLSLVRQTPLAEDVWHRGNFAARADYNPDGLGLRGLGMGVGYTDEEVDGVRVPREVLRDYQQQLLAETTDYLAAADDAAIRAERPSPLGAGQQLTSAARLQHIVAHSHMHIGEIRFGKGMHGITDPTYPKK